MHASEVLKIIGHMWEDFNAWDNDNTTPADSLAEAESEDESADLSLGDGDGIDTQELLEHEHNIVCASVICKKGFTLASVGLAEMPANKRRWYCPDCIENNPRVGRNTRRRV